MSFCLLVSLNTILIPLQRFFYLVLCQFKYYTSSFTVFSPVVICSVLAETHFGIHSPRKSDSPRTQRFLVFLMLTYWMLDRPTEVIIPADMSHLRLVYTETATKTRQHFTHARKNINKETHKYEWYTHALSSPLSLSLTVFYTQTSLSFIWMHAICRSSQNLHIMTSHSKTPFILDIHSCSLQVKVKHVILKK